MTAPAPCPFCQIVCGDIQAAVVGEGAGWLAFLDRSPLFFGHVLVVPREHRETLLDLAPDEVAPLFEAVQRVARAVTEGLASQGTFVAMNNKVGQSVAHLHVHVVPRTKGDGLKGFFWPRKKYPGEAEIEVVRAAIAARLA